MIPCNSSSSSIWNRRHVDETSVMWTFLVVFVSALIIVRIVRFGYVHCSCGRKVVRTEEWAVVTGCTGGIGLELVLDFARRGLNMCLVSRSESKLRRLRDRVRYDYKDVHVEIVPIEFGRADEDAWRALLSRLRNLPGRIRVLTNNVGIAQDRMGAFHGATWDEIRLMIDVNVTTATRLTHAVIPVLLEQSSPSQSSSIVFVGSAAGRHEMPVPMLAVYSATKAYLHALATAIDEEYGHKHIRVLSVTPGIVDETALSQRLFGRSHGSALLRLLPRPTAKQVARSIACQALRGVHGASAGHVTHGLQLAMRSLISIVCKSSYVAFVHEILRRRDDGGVRVDEETHFGVEDDDTEDARLLEASSRVR